jgi:sulfofructose kinase
MLQQQLGASKLICLHRTSAPGNYQTLIRLPCSFSLACAPKSRTVSFVPGPLPVVDIVGVGLNATDTLIRLPHFPAFNSKVEVQSSAVLPGGQVATAVTACARWGLSARYVGKIGDDAFGQLQKDEMEKAGVEAHWAVVRDCQSPLSFILVDEKSGERTVLWKRDPRVELLPSDLVAEWVTEARLLHVDGHDCAAATVAARLARAGRIPVTADLDNRYAGVEALLENVDYCITSRDFPVRVCGENDPFTSLPAMAARFGCRLVAATLGAEGVLAWDGTQFHYSPAFEVRPVDATGAGDVFHAAFAFALLNGYALPQSLEFSCAAAGLACMKLGARGGIATLSEIHDLIRSGPRRPAAYSQEQLETARVVR